MNPVATLRAVAPKVTTVKTPLPETSPSQPSPSTRLAGIHVAFIGAGPGDPGLLTIRARDLLGAADVVIADHASRQELLQEHASPHATVVVAPCYADDPAGGCDDAAARVLDLVAEAEPGDLVVRLMHSDSSLFDGFAEEISLLREAGARIDIVPGVSAVSAVPTYAGVPLTSAEATSVHVVSAREQDHDWSPDIPDHVTVVLLGSPELLGQALADLLAAGRCSDTPVAITERGTTTAQVTRAATLGTVKAILHTADVALPALAVVGPTVLSRSELSWFECKPLFGWRVLVPRTKDDTDGTLDRLASYGATTHVVPTLSVEPPRTPQQMDRAVRGLVLGRYEWIGFTSVNAVRAVREKFEQLGLDARAFAGLRIASVGGSTTEALQEWGLNPDLVPLEDRSAAGLAQAWPEYDPDLDPINRVFLPRADIATDVLGAGLEALGWEVEAITAYRTVRASPPPAEVREAIKSGRFDAVVFTSSATVRNLVGIAGKPHATTVVACIGPATAKTAQEHGLRVEVLPAEPTSEALVDALAEHGAALAAAAAEAGETLRRPSERRPANRRRAR